MYKVIEQAPSNCGYTGWGVGAAAILGAAAGYWAGSARNSCGFFNNAGGCGYGGNAYTAGGCTTCYQEGQQAGKTLAGIEYTAKTLATTNDRLEQYFANVNNQFQAVQHQFSNLSMQKIQDLQNEVNALKTQRQICSATCGINAQLVGLNDKMSSIVTGCGVRSYPGCPPCPPAAPAAFYGMTAAHGK